MSIRRLLSQPVIVQPQGPTLDAYGNSVLGPVGAGVAEFGHLEQKDSVEFLNDRQTTVSTWRAHLAPESVVTALAFLTFQGQTFQVDGEPWHVQNPRTRTVHHIECKLKEVT